MKYPLPNGRTLPRKGRGAKGGGSGAAHAPTAIITKVTVPAPDANGPARVANGGVGLEIRELFPLGEGFLPLDVISRLDMNRDVPLFWGKVIQPR